MSDVWAKLSAVDVNEHKAKKGQFDYLSWADAWAELMKQYPDSTHDMLEDVYYPDGTMEVRSSVTVDGRTLKCFLPVINHKNQAIQNPNAFDINKNRMRCLAKNIALFGLGIYIFRGEDFPETGPLFTESQKATFLTLLGEDDGWGLKHFAREVGNDIMTELFNDAPQGHKTKIKSQVRELVEKANAELRDILEAIAQALDEQSPSAIEEIFAELEPTQYDFIVAGLTPVQHQQLINMGIQI